MENKPINEIMGGELYHHGIVGVYSKPNPENYLAHYGVLGMHWGIRRFQPYSLIPRKSGKSGKETGAAKKSSKAHSETPSSAPHKSRNQKSADAAKAREKEAKTARERKDQINKIVRSGDINQIYEHRKELSEGQLREAIKRIDTEKEVAALYRKANPTQLEKMANTAKKLKDINDGFDQVAKAYNNVARVVNMATGEDTGEAMKFIKDANVKGKNPKPKKLKDNVDKANNGNGEKNVKKGKHAKVQSN